MKYPTLSWTCVITLDATGIPDVKINTLKSSKHLQDVNISKRQSNMIKSTCRSYATPLVNFCCFDYFLLIMCSCRSNFIYNNFWILEPNVLLAVGWFLGNNLWHCFFITEIFVCVLSFLLFFFCPKVHINMHINWGRGKG